MRRFLTSGMILLGIVLMISSYVFLAAPWGAETVANSNPRVVFAPGLFVIGVMLVFGSAVVYELLPDRGEPGTGE